MAAEIDLRQLFASTYLRYADVFTKPVDIATVASWLKELPTEAVLAVCSVLSRYASVHSLRDGSQLPMIDWALSPDLASKVKTRLAEGGDTPRFHLVFHHEQLLLAAKLAIVQGTDEAADPANVDQRHAIGQALLAVNDLLSVVATDENAESDRMLGLAVRALALSNVEVLPYQIARIYNMYVERAASTDIARYFTTTFRLEVAAFMAFSFLCAVPFEPWDTPLPPQLDIGAVLRAGRLLHERIRAHPDWLAPLDLLSADRDWFRERLGDGVVEGSTFYPFQERPLYRSSSGAIVPIHARFLTEKTGPGVFWMLHAAKVADAGHSIQTFMGTVGKAIVEPYCIDLLTNVTPSASGQRLIPGPPLGRYRSSGIGKVEGSDAYLLDGDRLIVFEITASGIPIGTLLSGDGARFRDDFERKMVYDASKNKRGKLGQLDRVIHDILDGRLVLPGVDVSALKTIYPLLLSQQYIPNFPTIRPVIDQLIAKHGFFAFAHPTVAVTSFRIMSIEEIEFLGGDLVAGGHRLADLLQGWLDDPVLHDSSMKNHLFRIDYVERDNIGLHAIYDRWTAHERHLLLESGLAHEVPAHTE
jgi:hypothetical protein